MRLRNLFLVLIALLAPLPSFAQDSKQKLNDQLWEAARRGDATEVTALLDQGADVNAKFRYGATALFKASERGHAEVVKVLLARGADASVKDTFYGATAMTWALDNNHVEVVRALLDKDANSVGNVLMKGAREGKAPLVEIALAKGGLEPEALTSALAATMDDKDKAAIAELLRKAGATPPIQIDAATLQSYAGKYRNQQGAEISFTFREEKLFATPTGQQPIAVIAIDKTSFKPVAFDGIKVTFTIEAGKVTGFVFKQGATTTSYSKVE